MTDQFPSPEKPNKPDNRPGESAQMSDEELSALLFQWESPSAPAELDPLVLNEYRRARHQAWWRRLSKMPFRVMMPTSAAAGLVIAFFAGRMTGDSLSITTVFPPPPAPISLPEYPAVSPIPAPPASVPKATKSRPKPPQTTTQRSTVGPEGVDPGGFKDMTVEDIALSLSDFKLLRNGAVVLTGSGEVGFERVGPLVWFQVPDQGQFILSVAPRQRYGFLKAGRVDANRISFTWNKDAYEVISSIPIIANGGKWNLWVRLVPNPPGAPEGKYDSGAADRLTDVLSTNQDLTSPRR